MDKQTDNEKLKAYFFYALALSRATTLPTVISLLVCNADEFP